MRKFLTIVSLALLLVAFGAASWGQAGHSKFHKLRERVTQLENTVSDLKAHTIYLTERVNHLEE